MSVVHPLDKEILTGQPEEDLEKQKEKARFVLTQFKVDNIEDYWIKQLFDPQQPLPTNLEHMEPLSDEKEREEIKALLVSLHDLVTYLQGKDLLKQYALVNWRPLLHKKLKTPQFADKSANYADLAMTIVYFLLNCLGLVLFILHLKHLDTNPTITSKLEPGSSFAWNGFDSVGGCITAFYQLWYGDTVLGLWNLFSSVQAITLSVIGDPIFHVGIHVSEVVGGAMLGGAFAAGMFIGCIIECIESYRCTLRIKELERRLSDLRLGERDKFLAYKALLLEKANLKNHERAAWSWLLCGIAMTLVVVALSVLSGGLAPTITVAMAIVTAVLRYVLTRYWNSMANMQKSLEPIELDDRVREKDPVKILSQKEILGINLKSMVAAPFYKMCMYKTTKLMTLRDYLEHLMTTNSKAARALLQAEKADIFLNLLEQYGVIFDGKFRTTQEAQRSNEDNSAKWPSISDVHSDDSSPDSSTQTLIDVHSDEDNSAYAAAVLNALNQ